MEKTLIGEIEISSGKLDIGDASKSTNFSKAPYYIPQELSEISSPYVLQDDNIVWVKMEDEDAPNYRIYGVRKNSSIEVFTTKIKDFSTASEKLEAFVENYNPNLFCCDSSLAPYHTEDHHACIEVQNGIYTVKFIKRPYEESILEIALK